MIWLPTEYGKVKICISSQHNDTSLTFTHSKNTLVLRRWKSELHSILKSKLRMAITQQNENTLPYYLMLFYPLKNAFEITKSTKN